MHTSAYALVFKNNIQYRYTCFEDIYFVKNRTREFYMEIHISYIYVRYNLFRFAITVFYCLKKKMEKTIFEKL